MTNRKRPNNLPKTNRRLVASLKAGEKFRRAVHAQDRVFGGGRSASSSATKAADMNLEWRHFPLIVLGGVVGSSLGWLASFLFKPGLFPQIESVVGPHGVGAVFGGIAGMGFAVVAIVARAARDPNVGPARYFMRINGMGSTLFGHSEPRDEGSYVTTEWFTLLSRK